MRGADRVSSSWKACRLRINEELMLQPKSSSSKRLMSQLKSFRQAEFPLGSVQVFI